MIEIIHSIIELLKTISEASTQYLGMDIFLIFPVFMILEIIIRTFNIKERYKKHKTLIILILNLVISFTIMLTTQDIETWQNYIKLSLYLSAVTSFSYSFWKGLYRFLMLKLERKIEGDKGDDETGG